VQNGSRSEFLGILIEVEKGVKRLLAKAKKVGTTKLRKRVGLEKLNREGMFRGY
jgi:hypothetical protein